jgi:putative ABC transport system substrate-binding protein
VNRRRWLVVAAALATVPSALAAEPAGVAWMTAGDEATQLQPDRPAGMFRTAMARLGWVEGRNVRYLWRFSGSDAAAVERAAREIAMARPRVVVTSGDVRTYALRKATAGTTIAIVTTVGDPVRMGHAESLARPGGRVTGLTHGGMAFVAKAAEFLASIEAPGRVAAWLHPAVMRSGDYLRPPVENALRSAGLEPVEIAFSDAAGLEAGLSRLPPGVRRAILFLVPQPVLTYAAFGAIAQRARVASFALQADVRIPGMLAGFDLSHSDPEGRMAAIADKLLRGQAAGTIPFEQPDRTRLGLNLATARALGVEVDRRWITLAEEVIP